MSESDDVQSRIARLEERSDRIEAEIQELRRFLTPQPPAQTTERRPEPPESRVPSAPPPAPREPVAAPLAAQRVPAPRAAPSEPILPSGIDIEALLSGRVMAWVGGLAVLVGSLFFLSLAFSRGWIGPETRVVIGLLAGAAMVSGGSFFFERRERLFGHVLLATGLGVYNLALFAATRLYDLVPYQVGLLATLAGAAVGAVVAIRARSQIVAVYGLLPALIAPVLFGASASAVTIAFLAAILAGTTAIALYRDWIWLPPLAFLLTFFQLYDWLDGAPPVAAGLLAIAGYWLVHVIAAGGEEYRTLRGRLRPTSASLMLLNAAAAVGAGFILLDGGLEEWRGLYFLLLAVAHFPIAGYFLYRAGDRNPFGMLTLGTGLATIAIAVPVQFDGPAVPIAWAAQGVALVWVYGRLRNAFSLGAGILYGILALWHLILFDYPLEDILARTIESDYPFLHGSGAALGFILLALATAGYLARSEQARMVATLAGAGLLAYALPFEFERAWLIVAWALLAAALFAAHRIEPAGHPLYGLAGTGLAGFAFLIALARVATPSRLRVSPDASVDHLPLWSDATLALAALAAALVAGWLLHRREYPRIAGLGLAGAGALGVYLLSIGVVDEFQRRLDDGARLSDLREQAQVALSLLWTVLGAASFVTGIAIRRIGARIFGLALLGLAILKVFIVDLASLDASYRVISFIALGLLLLLASYLYQRMMARSDGADASASA